MGEWITPVAVLLGVCASSTVTWFIAKRSTSGSISTSDAASLWEESNNLRQEYRQRATDLEKQLKEVNDKLQSVMDELGKLRGDNSALLEKIAELKGILSALREENKRLLSLKESTT